ATANGLREKNLCLSLALKLRDILNQEYEGHTLKLSREADTTVTLKQRTNMANSWGADYFVPIHINAGGGTGFESYIYNGNYASKPETNRLRNLLHDAIVKESGYRDRGKKEADFHVLRESTMYSVLTVNAYIDHRSDTEIIKNDTFLNYVDREHASGLARALGLRRRVVQYLTLQEGETLSAFSRQ